MENAIKITVISVVVVYVLITLYHLSNGFDFGSALGAGFSDFRAVLVCFGEWGEMKEFITRPAVAGDDIGGVALDLGLCQ